jgi:TRAP-type mannitol/chloroaromatic compound transport system permease large subunit
VSTNADASEDHRFLSDPIQQQIRDPNVDQRLLLVLGCLVDMAPSIPITTPILLPVVIKFSVDPVHFGMIMLMNLGIGLCHPPVRRLRRRTRADGRRDEGDLAVHGVMSLVLMAVTHIPAISLWLPRALSL